MKRQDASALLRKFAENGRWVYRTADLKKLFHEEPAATLRSTLKRLIAARVLVRAIRDVYVFNDDCSWPTDLLEQLAAAARRGEFCYVSLESALAEYGVISQIPVDRLTVMTTGRSGELATPMGVLEFTHTGRSVAEILDGSRDVGRVLRLATREAAIRDLKRVGRNLHLIQELSAYD